MIEISRGSFIPSAGNPQATLATFVRSPLQMFSLFISNPRLYWALWPRPISRQHPGGKKIGRNRTDKWKENPEPPTVQCLSALNTLMSAAAMNICASVCVRVFIKQKKMFYCVCVHARQIKCGRVDPYLRFSADVVSRCSAKSPFVSEI